jgi:electron transfer flavoprotein beta subunit
LNIIVCIKRVPDTETRIRIAEGGTEIDPSGVKYILSPYDEIALEAALQTRDGIGSGSVTVVSLGDPATAETLRSGLAMGADDAVLLTGDTGMDGLATAKGLAAELQSRDAPLILLGVKAADLDQQQVGPMLATLLDRPCLTSVVSFEVDGDRVTCRREVEGGTETVEVDLPAVITVTKGKYEPRYASLKGIMAAKRKPLEEKAAETPEPRIRVGALEYPPARPEGRIVGEGPEAAQELVRLLREEAKAL